MLGWLICLKILTSFSIMSSWKRTSLESFRANESNTNLSFTFWLVYDFQRKLFLRICTFTQSHHGEITVTYHPTNYVFLPQRQRQNNIIVFAQFPQQTLRRFVSSVQFFFGHFGFRSSTETAGFNNWHHQKKVNNYPFLRPGVFLYCCIALLSSNSSSKSSWENLSLP